MVGLIRCGQTRELVLVGHPVKFAGINDTAADRGIMAVHVFCGGMGDDVSAPFNRTAEDRCGECVVNDQRYAMGMSRVGKALNIKHSQCRVGNGLTEDTLGIGLESSFELLIAAVRINKCEVNAHTAHGDIEQIVCAAIDGCRSDDMVTAGSQIEDSEE